MRKKCSRWTNVTEALLKLLLAIPFSCHLFSFVEDFLSHFPVFDICYQLYYILLPFFLSLKLLKLHSVAGFHFTFISAPPHRLSIRLAGWLVI